MFFENALLQHYSHIEAERFQKTLNIPLPLLKTREPDLNYLVSTIISTQKRQLVPEEPKNSIVEISEKTSVEAKVQATVDADKNIQEQSGSPKKCENCLIKDKQIKNLQSRNIITELKNNHENKLKNSQERIKKILAKFEEVKTKLRESEVEKQALKDKISALNCSRAVRDLESVESKDYRNPTSISKCRPKRVKQRIDYERNNSRPKQNSCRTSSATVERRARVGNEKVKFRVLEPTVMQFDEPNAQKDSTGVSASRQRGKFNKTRNSGHTMKSSRKSSRSDSSSRFDPTEYVQQRERRSRDLFRLRDDRIRSAQTRSRSNSREFLSDLRSTGNRLLTKNLSSENSSDINELVEFSRNSSKKRDSKVNGLIVDISSDLIHEKAKSPKKIQLSEKGQKRCDAIDIEGRLTRLQDLLNKMN